MSIMYNSNEFDSAVNIMNKSSVLNRWISKLDTLRRLGDFDRNYNIIFDPEKKYRLTTQWVESNVFGEDDDAQISLIDYLHGKNVKIISTVVQYRKDYSKYPKPCLEKDVDEFDDAYRLLITYGFVKNQRQCFDPSSKKQLFTYGELRFYNLLNSPSTGSLNKQCQFDVLYYGNSLQFAVITSRKDLLDFMNLINTCINRYNCLMKQNHPLVLQRMLVLNEHSGSAAALSKKDVLLQLIRDAR